MPVQVPKLQRLNPVGSKPGQKAYRNTFAGKLRAASIYREDGSMKVSPPQPPYNPPHLSAWPFPCEPDNEPVEEES